MRRYVCFGGRFGKCLGISLKLLGIATPFLFDFLWCVPAALPTREVSIPVAVFPALDLFDLFNSSLLFASSSEESDGRKTGNAGGACGGSKGSGAFATANNSKIQYKAWLLKCTANIVNLLELFGFRFRPATLRSACMSMPASSQAATTSYTLASVLNDTLAYCNATEYTCVKTSDSYAQSNVSR